MIDRGLATPDENQDPIESSWCLFGEDDESDSDESGSNNFVPNPIPTVIIDASAYGAHVVTLSASTESGNTNTELASSVHMAGCGASVKLLQPNHSNNIEGTGGVAWGCAPALCTILAGSASCYPNATTSDNLVEIDFSDKVVLELGSGTGALGLWIATKWPSTTVILSDLSETMPNLRENIAANNLQSRCTASELAFGADLPSFLKATKADSVFADSGVVDFPGIDVIVASDCQFSTFADFVWQPFVATLASAAPRTQVWISLQERYGTSQERLEPFLNALQKIADVRRRTSAAQSSTGTFVELFHPHLLEESAPFYDAEYPHRCFYLSL